MLGLTLIRASQGQIVFGSAVLMKSVQTFIYCQPTYYMIVDLIQSKVLFFTSSLVK